MINIAVVIWRLQYNSISYPKFMLSPDLSELIMEG